MLQFGTDEKGDTRAAIRRAAMDLLARREHSRMELIRKLSRRFGQPELLESVVLELANQGLQSDQRMAEAYLRSRMARGYGPVKIAYELREKGVASDIVDSLVHACGVDWLAQIATVVKHRYGDKPSDDLKEKAKRQRFLQRRGFGFEHIASLESL